MISQYSGALRSALLDVFQLVVRIALPLAIVVGLVAAAAAIAYTRDPEGWRRPNDARKSVWAKSLAYGFLAFAAYLGFSLLQAMLPVAQDRVAWEESAEATRKPLIDAQPIEQSGPVVAALKEKTYTRRLTLPPDLVSKIGSEGLGVLQPYLTDPSAENVLRLVDTFRRSGQDVVFTREVARLEEEPLALAKADVVAEAQRLDSQAFDLKFHGTYTFRNDQSDAIQARFQFPIPQEGSMRELKVEVDGQPLSDPNDMGLVEWIGPMDAGQSKKATVSFRIVGADSWGYRVGSSRRRVEDFNLVFRHDGEVRFPRSTMKPSSQSDGKLDWSLKDVITDERIAVSFPPDTVPLQTYLQAIESMPMALALFLVGTLGLALSTGREMMPNRVLLALVALTLGFAFAPIVASYLGYAAGILITPVLGGLIAGLIARPVGWVPAVLAGSFPGAFLSAENTGLLLILYAVIGWLALRRTLRPDA